ncbi:hypothetical protein J7T55_007930 [Diaporthe amygdali]|uniref:uncharacterized protein n=1 Tax=Phomopsis amygdali TaxID=1214568 RepID=UPI0022FEECB4|nr:uncharacterized protein J7T55_007930 [Diaporthe amygdali]KAJ0114096.1 hypothetical protein J7T55_007930 [Diaporthe amygdali]
MRSLVAFMASVTAVRALSLNITAVGATNNVSTLECWQMDTPFASSTIPGITGSATAVIGTAANISYTVLPAAFDGGLHNAPFNQWVVFISGLAYVTLPTDDTAGAYIVGGEFGLVFAADTAEVSAQGHRTQYPGTTETVALAIPTADGLIPGHTVLHDGACTANDIEGLRGLAFGLS